MARVVAKSKKIKKSGKKIKKEIRAGPSFKVGPVLISFLKQGPVLIYPKIEFVNRECF